MKKLIEEYMEFCRTTAIYPGRGTEKEVIYLFLGLMGEYSEWINSVSINRQTFHRSYDPKEAGDVCWYVARLCDVLNLNTEELLTYGLNKSDQNNLSELPNIHEVMKKYLRDGKDPTNALINQIKHFMSDINFYHDLTSILKDNIKKLSERKQTGTLQGSGETVEERRNGTV